MPLARRVCPENPVPTAPKALRVNLGYRVLQDPKEVSLFIDTIIIYNFILYSVANLRIIIIFGNMGGG